MQYRVYTDGRGPTESASPTHPRAYLYPPCGELEEDGGGSEEEQRRPYASDPSGE
jgi:hypothetical protein